jgi:predicted phosphodiesterase
MKILIFSDSHLTHKFDKELFDYISKIIKDVDQVIINGDFWDGYLTTFDKFVNSEWQQLFPVLKEKNTVYIFGNHDKKEFSDDRVNLFSNNQSNYYEFKSENKKFYIAHGHLMSQSYDSFFLFKNHFITRILYVIYMFFVKFRIFSFIHKKMLLKRNKKTLSMLRKFSNKNIFKKDVYIFGHSHLSFINKKLVSLGSLQNKEKNYCLIENGSINCMKE